MKEKIKVLWVTNTVGCGGAQRQILYMYEIIKKYCNIDIDILYYAKCGEELNIDGVNCIYVDKKSVGKLKTIKAIRKYIKQNNIQIMHAFGGRSANEYGRLGAIGTKAIPVGAMLGKKHFVSFKDKVVNSFLNLFGNWWTVNNNELTPILLKDLAFAKKKRVRLLHNGFVPAEQIDYCINEQTEYDVDKGNAFVFAVVGRLQPVKNYKLFLKAAKRIVDETQRDVRFWVVGNGEEYENLVNLSKELGIEEKVKFWGYKSDVDVIMSRVDVFMQTSFTEGSPNTVAEAMRISKPIITTNSTDFSEMIDEGVNGYLVESDNCDALVDAMKKTLSKTDKELKLMGERSKELFEKTFLDIKVAQEFDSFYKELLKIKD